MLRELCSLPFVLSTPLFALPQNYKLPPQDVVDLLDAPTLPGMRLSPDAQWLLVTERPSMPSLPEVGKPWLGLAGLRIDPAANAPQQLSFDRGLVLRTLDGANSRRVALPQGARIGSVDWSHDSARFAFTLVADDRVELWVCATNDAKPQRVALHLNTIFGGYEWMPDGERLLVKLVPDARAAAPVLPRDPSGPTTMESAGKKSPVRTFQDLLTNEHDALLFEHFGRSQLAIVDPNSGTTTNIGAPDLFVATDVSPDGEHVLVARAHRPFSYVLTYDRFPRRTEVWSKSGALEYIVSDAPLQDVIPIEGVPTGPRNIAWRPNERATLVWVEALDGGDPKAKALQRDKWLAFAAPFKGFANELLRTQHRARGLSWFADPKLVLATDYDRDRRWTRATLHTLDNSAAAIVLEDRSVNDRYGNPGSLLTMTRADGTRVVRRVGDWIYRAGEGDSTEGARPFLARQNIATHATERLWSCDIGTYESVAAFRDSTADGVPTIVTRRETPLEPPNLHLRDLAAKSATQMTNFADPQPQIRGIAKRLVTYERDDGVKLSATLYTPANYVEGTRLPLVVWAYPLEFNDASTAGQVGGSPFRFTQIRGLSQLVFLTQGYAVMDDATMPIVGDPETMNDTFIAQIGAAAKAAIDKAAALGVADPARVGVGGHSYGAFMTANLLAHTDLFKAGCARSGAYNRSLTPFGFQSERRTIWEAPQIYAQLSPFNFADKINEPLLLIHGEKDANPGTFPIQSERLYQAVSGNGGTVRLVLLPEESHGYSARASVLHVQAESIEWFDRYVKGEPPVVDASAPKVAR